MEEKATTKKCAEFWELRMTNGSKNYKYVTLIVSSFGPRSEYLKGNRKTFSLMLDRLGLKCAESLNKEH